MKVKKLIEELIKCQNLDAEVTIMDIEGNYDADVLQVEGNGDLVFFTISVYAHCIIFINSVWLFEGI